MIPLSDNAPNHTTPWLTYLLIAACILAYIWQVSGPQGFFEATVQHFGFVPARFFGPSDLTVPYGLYTGPSPTLTIFTSMFLHGSVAHITGNLLYLWVFGDNLENHLGKAKFILFYLATGVAAAMAQGLVDPTSAIPMVGASGAISGVMGGYIILHPRQPITVLVPNAFVTTLPAYVMLGLWFAYQLILGIATNPAEGGVAFFAHIGGFVAGVALILPFRHPRRQKPRLWR